mmetsp:Transcript_12169/g.12174  ORF Transcript_12169/g.12174 Transcript_12169/m.12174 type:complete len:260 (-) Transcript_12169:46-825(-)
MLVLQLVGLFIHGFIGYYYNLSVGIMTLDDYYLWSYQFNKAHTKVSAISFGLTMAYIYLRILEYRKSNDDDKKKNFKIIDFMHKSTIVTIFLYLYSILIFAFITLIVRSANDDAYSWSRMQNTLYTIAARPLLLTVIMSLLLIIFMGKGHIAKYLMTSRIWLPLSNLTYAGYLIYPIVIGANFYASQRAFFITNPSIIFAMLSNIIICYLGALVLHIFVQAPIDRVLKTTYQVVRNSRGSLETMSEQESLLEPNEITKL